MSAGRQCGTGELFRGLDRFMGDITVLINPVSSGPTEININQLSWRFHHNITSKDDPII